MTEIFTDIPIKELPDPQPVLQDKAGNVQIPNIATMQMGTGNSSFFVDQRGLWLGSSALSTAPFSVTVGGVLVASQATITGSITATSGAIGGFTIGSDYVRDAADSMGLASTVTGGNDIRFWAGSTFANRATAPFRVYEDGSIVATSATITIASLGGFDIGADYIRDTGNSFGLASTVTGGDDIRFWAGDTFANRATAPFHVSEAGAVTMSNVTITGGSITGAGMVSVVALNIANRGWTQTCAFSVTDADTVAWGSGSFVTADGGTTLSISAGNTGNMSAKTYIYLDAAVSLTAYQITTTASTAVGASKVLIAIAQNATGEATFQVMNGMGGQNIDASNIVANSITANELSTSITYAGAIIIDTSGNIRSGQTAYNTGTGWFIGNDGGTPKLSIGDGGTTNYLTWDGTSLTINGYTQTNVGTFGGNGSDGALAVSSGTTNIDLGGAAVFVKNYTSISITGTGAITFSNPHANGTQIIFKSLGAVTITSSATRAIDLRSLGCTGGAGAVAGATAGAVGTDSNNIIDTEIHYGGGGAGAGSSPPGAGGVQITQAIGLYANVSTHVTATRFTLLVPGAGGGGGGAGDGGAFGAGGNGGRGAGCMIIECRGAYNVSGTIDLSGAAGANGANGTGTSSGGGGGGGGAGGMFLAMYNTLTADSGTYTVAGGAAGTGGSGAGNVGGDGGAGGGSTEAAGSDGSANSGSDGGAGGAGAAGIAIRMLNNAFA